MPELIVTSVQIKLTTGGQRYRALVTISNGDTYERTEATLIELLDSIRQEFGAAGG